MDDLKHKIRLIYLPFFLITITFIVGYTFLNWLLIVETELISIKEDIVNIWMPIAFPWIPVLIWLRPRIRLLLFKGNDYKQEKKREFYYFAATLAMTIPTIVAQHYIVPAVGELINIESVKEIDQHTTAKYYTLQSYYIDKSHPGVYRTAKAAGRYGEYLDFSTYVVCPIFEKANDTLAYNVIRDTAYVSSNVGVRVWLGVKLTKRISNRTSKSEKEKQFDSFAIGSYEAFKYKDLNTFQYLDRIGNNEDRDGYLMASLRSRFRPPTQDRIILVGVNEPFEIRTGNSLPWVLGSFLIASCLWLLLLFFPSLNHATVERFLSGRHVINTKLGDSFAFLVPHKDFFATPILLDLNIMIFLIMVITGLGLIDFKVIDLVNRGANAGPLTLNGEWWRLATSIFLHGGIIHLIANMSSLLLVGMVLESWLGSGKFAVFYIITGILASITSVWWNSEVVSVGASGAIFGMYGILLSLLLTGNTSKVKSNRPLLISIGGFVAYNLLFGLMSGVIDNAAHVGGLTSGFIIGLIIRPTLED